MASLADELARARALDVESIADAVESIGFECTRCGACCRGDRGDHTATVFPDEIRGLQKASADADGSGTADRDWREVARPVPFGLRDGEEGLEGETFEWALQTGGCGDCVFYEEGESGRCTVHPDRPLICESYPFSLALGGTSQPMGEAVDGEGMVRAHECEGLGRDISRADAEAMAHTLKKRAIRELEEAIAVRENYDPVATDSGEVVVHDSEGQKRPDGTSISDAIE